MRNGNHKAEDLVCGRGGTAVVRAHRMRSRGIAIMLTLVIGALIFLFKAFDPIFGHIWLIISLS